MTTTTDVSSNFIADEGETTHLFNNLTLDDNPTSKSDQFEDTNLSYRGLDYIQPILNQLDGWHIEERIKYWNLRAAYWDRQKLQALKLRDHWLGEIKMRKLERKLSGIDLKTRSPIKKHYSKKRETKAMARSLILSGFS